MARFPTVAALAAAPLDEVLALWAGLGYYSRARNLHAAARAVVERHGGIMPREPEALAALPGIGRYTVGAIGSIAFGHRLPVVDGNVKRILSRVFGVEAGHALWDVAAELVPADAPSEFNQGLMDLGATMCTPKQPRCLVCPLAALCVARRDGRQAELPGTKPQRVVPVVEVDVIFAVRDGRWLLARRAPRGLYGGLWELPEAAALGLHVAGAPIATHTQKLTHRTLVYRVHEVDAGAAPHAAAPYDATQYVAPAALAGLAVSSATTALARVLQARGNRWPTPKKRSSSSPRVSRRSSKDSASSATTSTTPTSSTRRRAPRAGSER
jgi:A/G-specific adenine glycosylase